MLSHKQKTADRGNRSPVNSLWRFVLGLGLILTTLEVGVRMNAPIVEAASHRALTKVAMFDKHPSVKILFFGTSRTQDAVSPVLVSRQLAKIAPDLGDVPGFNAAFTGSSLDALIALVPRYGFRKGLKAAVIELSVPQLYNGTVPWEDSTTPTITLEDRLNRAARQFFLIRYRSVFLSDNIGRLPGLLLFSSSLSGWETRANDQIASFLGRQEKSASDFDPGKWVPEVFSTSYGTTTGDLDPKLAKIADQLTTIAKHFSEHGIKVAFVVPPLARAYVGPEKNSLRPLYAQTRTGIGL